MLICYDQMWPESAACCALNGAQIICQPSAASLTDYHMRTRAMDNQVHHVSSTYANSMIVSPRAEVLADAQHEDPAIAWADVDVRGATRGDEFFYETLYSGIQDHKQRHLNFRRSDTYHVLTEKRPPLANQYPAGGVANTPESIAEVYRQHKEAPTERLARRTGSLPLALVTLTLPLNRNRNRNRNRNLLPAACVWRLGRLGKRGYD